MDIQVYNFGGLTESQHTLQLLCSSGFTSEYLRCQLLRARITVEERYLSASIFITLLSKRGVR